jgi:hypothetical protein
MSNEGPSAGLSLGGHVDLDKAGFPLWAETATARYAEVSSMDQVLKVGDLFSREPVQWGLRGDPQVWAAMRQKLAGFPMPSDWYRPAHLALRDLS